MKELIITEKAPKPIGPYSQAIKIGNLVFLSGQIGIDASGILKDNLQSQVHQIFQNIKSILNQINLSLDSIVKTTIYLTNLNDFNQVNEIYQSYFQPPYPARTTVEVSKLPKSALIEIDAIAYCE
jgi:2-iminobutanoate/2-iminopropanoate deaminase